MIRGDYDELVRRIDNEDSSFDDDFLANNGHDGSFSLESIHMELLERVDRNRIKRIKISLREFAFLVGLGHFPLLEELVIRQSRSVLSVNMINLLQDLQHLSQLRTLEIYDSVVIGSAPSSTQALDVAMALQRTPKLESLVMNNIHITGEEQAGCLSPFISALSQTTLSRLSLQVSTFSYEALVDVEAIDILFQSSTLRDITLNGFALNDDHFNCIGRGLLSNKRLDKVDLRKNWIVSVEAYSNMLKVMERQFYVTTFEMNQPASSIVGSVASFAILNAMGREQLVREKQASAWLKMLAIVSYDLNAIFFLFSQNPGICSNLPWHHS